jgi:hypothetical protein
MLQLKKCLFLAPFLLTAHCEGETIDADGADAADDVVVDQAADGSLPDAGETEGDAGDCTLTTDGRCESPLHNCCGWGGRRYRWDPEHQCKALVGPPEGELFCFAEPGPKLEQWACISYNIETCYTRTESDGTITIMLSSLDISENHFEGTGLVKCDSLFESEVRAAPAC